MGCDELMQLNLRACGRFCWRVKRLRGRYSRRTYTWMAEDLGTTWGAYSGRPTTTMRMLRRPPWPRYLRLRSDESKDSEEHSGICWLVAGSFGADADLRRDGWCQVAGMLWGLPPRISSIEAETQALGSALNFLLRAARLGSGSGGHRPEWGERRLRSAARPRVVRIRRASAIG